MSLADTDAPVQPFKAAPGRDPEVQEVHVEAIPSHTVTGKEGPVHEEFDPHTKIQDHIAWFESSLESRRRGVSHSDA